MQTIEVESEKLRIEMEQKMLLETEDDNADKIEDKSDKTSEKEEESTVNENKKEK